MTPLSALLIQIEGATGPDRELDCLIWAEMNGRDVRWDGKMALARSRRPPHDECRLGTIDPGRVQRNFSEAWHKPPISPYTGSTDAAIALVEQRLPNSDWDLDRTIMEDGAPQFGCRIFVAGKLGNHAGEAVTAPLAILSALLRTLIAQEETP